MAWARRKGRRVPADIGRPRRREAGFAQYVSNSKKSRKSNSNNIA